jgi:cell division protein FtsN
MAGTAALADAVIPSPGYEGMMAFLPIGTQLPALEAPGAADPMAKALAELRPAYDVTLVSAPCLDRRGKVHPAASACEGVLLILSPTVVSRDRIRRNFLQLWGVEAPIRGLITLGVPDVLAEVLPQGEARSELETLPKPTNLSLARGGSAAVGSLHSAASVSTADARSGGGEDDHRDHAQAEEDPGIDLEWAPSDDGGQDNGDPDGGVDDGDAGAHATEADEIAFDASEETDADEDDEFVYAGSGEDEGDEYDDEAHDADDESTFEAIPHTPVGEYDGGDGGDGSRGRLVMIAAAAAVALAAAAWLWPTLSGGGDERSGSLAAYEGSDGIPDEVVLTESSVGAGSTAVDAGDVRGEAPARERKLPDGARGDTQSPLPDTRWQAAATELTEDPDPTGRSWIAPRTEGATSTAEAIKTTSPPRVEPKDTKPAESETVADSAPPASAAVIDAKSGTIRSSQFDGREPFYAVHITSFRKRSSALADAERLARRTGYPVDVVECYLQGAGSKSGTWYRVLVGEFSDRDAATVAKSTFIDEGITDWCRVYNVKSR